MRGRFVRRALAVALAAVLAGAALGACGGGSGPTTSVPDKEADAELMNEVLGRQLAVVDAYPAALPKLRGLPLAEARRFRAQEQEHVDATTKALRGLGSEADPPAETIEAGELKTADDALRFLYAMENATIEAELSAISKLTGSWPRVLLASMVANQAQRLALIRRALGEKPLETVPGAFEDGTTPAPEEMIAR
jgi:ferritin-like protein